MLCSDLFRSILTAELVQTDHRMEAQCQEKLSQLIRLAFTHPSEARGIMAAELVKRSPKLRDEFEMLVDSLVLRQPGPGELLIHHCKSGPKHFSV